VEGCESGDLIGLRRGGALVIAEAMPTTSTLEISPMANRPNMRASNALYSCHCAMSTKKKGGKFILKLLSPLTFLVLFDHSSY
jgi:hypothetical protein